MGKRPELLDEEEADGAADGHQHDEDHDDDPPGAEAGGVLTPGVKRTFQYVVSLEEEAEPRWG